MSLLLAACPALGAEEPGTDMPPCIACQVDVETMRGEYSDEEWRRLTAGEVLASSVEERTEEGNPLHNAQASAIIEHPPDQVWTVVTDLESRPRYVPGNKEVKIVRVDGNRVWSLQHLRVLFMNIRFGVVSTLEPEQGVMRFVLDRDVGHDIEDTDGSWRLAPLRERRSTLVRYRTRVDTGRPIPGFVQSFFTRRSLPKLLEGVRQEVERRFSH
jgi:ribosome-associated toxin RatA of RatAB toxin-antitoxin module